MRREADEEREGNKARRESGRRERGEGRVGEQEKKKDSAGGEAKSHFI